MKNFLRLTSFFFILSLYKQFIYASYTVHKEMYRSLLNFFSQNAALKTIVIPLSTVFTRVSAVALINPMRRLFE